MPEESNKPRELQLGEPLDDQTFAAAHLLVEGEPQLDEALAVHERLKNSAEFTEAQATEVARVIGGEMTTMFLGIGIPSDLVGVFDRKVAKPVEVQFDNWLGGELSHYEMMLPWKEEQENEDFSVVALGRKSVSGWSEDLKGAVEAAGATLNALEDYYDLAYGWMIAHELGHGIQYAFSYTQRKPSTNALHLWDYPRVVETFLDKHPEERAAPNPDDSSLIEAERQAEGMGRLYLKKLLEDYGLSDELIERISKGISAKFAERGADSKALLEKTSEKVGLSDVVREMDGSPKYVNALGYATPLSPDQLVDRFSF